MRYTATIANTLIDKHGDCLTKEALEQLVASIQTSLIPMNVEHDPRSGPCGRLVSADVKQRTDGEYEVVAEIEMFDEVIEELSDGREIVQSSFDKSGKITITWDRSYQTNEDQTIIQEFTQIINGSSEQQLKKSIEPISILWLISGFIGVVGSSFLTGFFGKMGSDTWDVAKGKLSTLMERKAKTHEEYLLIFSFQVSHLQHGHIIEVEVCLENPRESEIKSFLNKGLRELDLVVPLYVESSNKLRKLFFRYDTNGLDLQYGVRHDCAPMKFKISTKELLSRYK